VSHLNHPWLPHACAALLALVALAGALQVSARVFDRQPHVEDEVAFIFQAQTIAMGRLLADAPADPDFFRAPFVIVRDGHWFGKYTPGFPLVLAAGALVGRPWLVNPLLAAACVGLVYVAGRRFYGAWWGVLAAAFLTASPFFLLQAGSYMSHLASLCWTLLFLLLFDRAHRLRLVLPSLGAGLALGMLFLTRPLTAVGVALPFLVWCGVHILRDRRRLLVYLPIALGFLPFVGLLMLYNRLTTGDPFESAYVLWWPYDRVGFGEGIGVEGHHTVRDGIRFLRINFGWLRMYVYGWPFSLSLIPAGVATLVALGHLARQGWRAALVRRGARWRARPWSDRNAPSTAAIDLLLAGILVGIMVAHIAYSTPGFMYGPRYYFEGLGAIALLTARGVGHLAAAFAWLLHRRAPRLPQPRLAALGLVLLAAAGLSAHGYTHFAAGEFRTFTGWNNVTGDHLRTVQAADLSHAVVFVQRNAWTDYAPFFAEHGPDLNADVVYAIDLGPERNRDLMRQYPGRTFYRYADGRLRTIRAPATVSYLASNTQQVSTTLSGTSVQ
jgi:4-amino-4-deoxy-L-arabinose transferase-like glycosyltransferase